MSTERLDVVAELARVAAKYSRDQAPVAELARVPATRSRAPELWRVPLRWLCAALCILALLTQNSTADQLLVTAAKVYTMTGPPWEPGAVLIADGKIVRVGPPMDAPAETKVLDLGSGILIPGLVDAYSAADVVDGRSELTREVTPDFHVLSAINWQARAFREALDEGITCINLTPGSENVLAGVASAVKTAGDRNERVANAETGLIVTVASDPSAQNRSRVRPDSIYVRQPTNRMGVIWILRSSFDRITRNRPVAKVTAAASSDSGSSERRPEGLVAGPAAARALTGNLRVFALSRAHFEISSLLTVANEFGFSPVVLGGQEAYKISDRLAKSKVPVVLSPLTTGSLKGPDDTDIFWNLPGQLHAAGVTFSLSGGDLLEQAQFAVRFGLPPDAALQAITSTPASLLGLGGRVGAISAGCDADMVALSGEPLEFSTALRWVMVNGKIYHQEN